MSANKFAGPTISLAPGEQLDEEKFKAFMKELKAHMMTPVDSHEEAMELLEANMAAARAALAVYEEAVKKAQPEQGPLAEKEVGDEEEKSEEKSGTAEPEKDDNTGAPEPNEKEEIGGITESEGPAGAKKINKKKKGRRG